MRDREFVNRFCAFQIFDLSLYEGDIHKFLAECLTKMNDPGKGKLTVMFEEFHKGLSNKLLLFGKHAFRRHERGQTHRNVLNASFWDVMSTGLSKYSEEQIRAKANEVREVVYDLLNDKDFDASIRYGPNSAGRVRHRFDVTRRRFRDILGAPGISSTGIGMNMNCT